MKIQDIMRVLPLFRYFPKSMVLKLKKKNFCGNTGRGEILGEKVMLVKPQTYMNLSGECISQIMHFYKVSAEDLIVIYDDIDIEMGKIRVKPKGHSGSHNGMRNIISLIGTENFARVRVGTDKPEIGYDLADFVLKKLSKEEKEKLENGLELAVKAIEEILTNGIESAMNICN